MCYHPFGFLRLPWNLSCLFYIISRDPQKGHYVVLPSTVAASATASWAPEDYSGSPNNQRDSIGLFHWELEATEPTRPREKELSARQRDSNQNKVSRNYQKAQALILVSATQHMVTSVPSGQSWYFLSKFIHWFSNYLLDQIQVPSATLGPLKYFPVAFPSGHGLLSLVKASLWSSLPGHWHWNDCGSRLRHPEPDRGPSIPWMCWLSLLSFRAVKREPEKCLLCMADTLSPKDQMSEHLENVWSVLSVRTHLGSRNCSDYSYYPNLTNPLYLLKSVSFPHWSNTTLYYDLSQPGCKLFKGEDHGCHAFLCWQYFKMSKCRSARTQALTAMRIVVSFVRRCFANLMIFFLCKGT